MKTIITLGACSLLLAVAVTGCKKKPEYPFCKSDKDCKEGEMCHNGKCVQCVSDSDCNEGQMCMDGICAAAEAKVDKNDKDKVAAGSVLSSDTGCTIKNVYFDFDSSELRPDTIEELKKVGNCLISKGAKKVIILGHCDPQGTEEYNMGLGLARARSIKKFLAAYGISKKAIKVYSKGEEYAEGTDEAGWALDRKGEFEGD